MAGSMTGLMAEGPELVVAGGVGAMALVALLWFVAHRRDPIPLWLGLFCACLCVHFLVGPAHRLEAPSAYLAGPFLVFYAAALYPGGWQRFTARVALAVAALAAVAALQLPPGS